MNSIDEAMEHDGEKNITFFRFEDLRIYHKALDYIEWLHAQSEKFINGNEITLGGRFRQAAEEIALNIAEGSARNKSQFIYYLKMAKSAVRQCVVFTTVSSHLNLLTADDEDHSRTQLMEMTKMLGALIGSLQRSSQHYESDNDD